MKFALSSAAKKEKEKRIAPIQKACIEGSQSARDLIPRFVEVFEREDGPSGTDANENEDTKKSLRAPNRP